jgi:ABC-type methionine transport system permease subunit
VNPLFLIILVLVIFALIGAPGIGPWHHSYGWYPSGIGVVIVVVLILLLLGGRL